MPEQHDSIDKQLQADRADCCLCLAAKPVHCSARGAGNLPSPTLPWPDSAAPRYLNAKGSLRLTGWLQGLPDRWNILTRVGLLEVAVAVSGSDDDDAFALVLKQAQQQKPRLAQQPQGSRLAPIQRPAEPSGAQAEPDAANALPALRATQPVSHPHTRTCRPGKDHTCKCVPDCHECLVDGNNTVGAAATPNWRRG